ADNLLTRLKRRARGDSASCWQILVTVTGLTRSQPQPSARFPWFDHRSRNRSPPIELSVEHGQDPTIHVQRGEANPNSPGTTTLALWASMVHCRRPGRPAPFIRCGCLDQVARAAWSRHPRLIAGGSGD